MLYLFNRILPYLSALLVGITFTLWIIRPEWAWYYGGALFLIATLTLWSLTSESAERRAFWQFIATPLALLASAFAYFFVIDNNVLRSLFIGGIVIIYVLILRNIFAFMHHTEQYQPYALENIYGYVNLLSLFLFYGAFFGLSMLLAWPFWIFVILMFILTAGLFMRTLWSYKIPWQRAKLFVLIVGLVAAEGGYAISLLPTNYVVNALWLVAVYYLLMNIIKDYLKDVLSPQRTRTYLLISSLAIILTMLTTKWQ